MIESCVNGYRPFSKGIIISLFFITFFSFGQSKSELQKLEDFAKLYGTIRYFHPSDEASRIDWKKLSIYGVREILNTNTEQEFYSKLNEIFTPIASSISFNGTNYEWDSVALYPVYWVHYGLGIDNEYPGKFQSYRYNKTKSIFHSKSAALFVPYQINTGKTLKLSYYAKSESEGKSFGLLKAFDTNHKVIQSAIETNNPIKGNDWEYRELIINDIKAVNHILIGLFAEGNDGSFKNVKLLIKKEDEIWEEINLPTFTEDDWSTEPKGNYLIREKSSITLKNIIESEQLKKTTIDSLLNPFVQLKLSNDVVVKIPTIVYADEYRTLPVADSNRLQDIIKQINKIDTNEFNRTVSLSNAIIIWNVFRHFYVYQDELNLKWDVLLRNLLKDAYQADTKEKHLLVLEKFSGNFKDGHIRISQENLTLKFDDIYCTPLNFDFVEGKLIVRNYKNNFNGVIKKGTVINKINDIPTQIFIDSISNYISGSKQYKKVKLLRRINEGAKDSVLRIKTAENNEIEISRTVSFKENEDFFKNNFHEKCKEITESIFYVNLSKLDEHEIDSLIPIINRYKGLIIDNRGYPKDRRHRIFSYFSAVDTTKWLATTKILNPNYFNIKQTFNGYQLNKNKFDTKLKTKNVLLMNGNTISNAELFGQLFKHYNLATIIGQPTAGANGDMNSIKLLGGFRVLFTGLKVKNPDGSLFHSIGIPPDIEVNESINDILYNKDVFIDEAVKYLNKKV